MKVQLTEDAIKAAIIKTDAWTVIKAMLASLIRAKRRAKALERQRDDWREEAISYRDRIGQLLTDEIRGHERIRRAEEALDTTMDALRESQHHLQAEEEACERAERDIDQLSSWVSRLLEEQAAGHDHLTVLEAKLRRYRRQIGWMRQVTLMGVSTVAEIREQLDALPDGEAVYFVVPKPGAPKAGDDEMGWPWDPWMMG